MHIFIFVLRRVISVARRMLALPRRIAFSVGS
jgi:hypothetical protein